jgi:glycosyltransferase involved in cell wall biosynthesis
MVGSIYDQELLDQLYGSCASYLHGHSVGGTNPSLLRAMGAAAPVLAIDIVFTREVLGETGRYFADRAALSALFVETERDTAAALARGRAGQDRASERYVWDDVAAGYEALCRELAAGR